MKMKAFDFRLQTKLDISLLQKDIARENLQASLQARDEIAQELNQLAERVQAIESSIRESSHSPSSFPFLLTRRQYLPVLHTRKNEVQTHLHEAETVVDTMRVKLLEQARETSALEKIKERRFQEYQKEAQQEEQKIIDELAMSGHFRKNLNKV